MFAQRPTIYHKPGSMVKPKINIADAPKVQSRNSIEDIWGPRTPYKHEWPVRVDEAYDEEPEKWVQSACILCSNGCGVDIGVKDGKVVGVRGRQSDRVNKGRLGPKGLNGYDLRTREILYGRDH
jgi:ferredoxin-nitrate reductase